MSFSPNRTELSHPTDCGQEGDKRSGLRYYRMYNYLHMAKSLHKKQILIMLISVDNKKCHNKKGKISVFFFLLISELSIFKSIV